MNGKTLLCITTCNRLHNIELFALDYIQFCNNTPDFDFLISLDGNAQEYLDFCEKHQIPLVYSEHREGVGLSKNRVLSLFPDYEYYFFFDDDIELLDSQVFSIQLKVAKSTGFHHFSLCPEWRILDIVSKSESENYSLIHALLGGGAYNFFTGKGLKEVGGWNTRFAEFKRFGHTEHSYRFYHKGLTPAPFNIIEECIPKFKWHEPPTVTQFDKKLLSERGYSIVEEEMLTQNITFFELATLCNFTFNSQDPSNKSMIRSLIPKNYNSSKSVKFLGNPFLKKREKHFLTRERAFENAMTFFHEGKKKAFFNEWIIALLYCRNIKRLATFIYYPLKLSLNKIARV